MKKLKIGEYIRIEDRIEKITNIDEWVDFSGYNEIITTDKNRYETIYEKSKILKSSSNIIDLIEVGDYVNGYKVIDIVKGLKVIIDKLELDTSTGLYHNIGITNIKSILTKEQFESMEYNLGDKENE